MTQSTPARILIVEDDPVVSATLEHMLLSAGYTIAGKASGGHKAVELAGQLAPDLILMDILLDDDIDGITASHEIARATATPVVFISSLDDAETIESTRKSGPFGYIRKPCDERELVIVIENALYRHSTEKDRDSHNRRLSMILENMGEALIYCLADGSIDYINPAGEALFDCRLSSVFGGPLSQLFSLPGSTQPPQPDTLPEEARIITASGQQLDVTIRHTTLHGDDGMIFLIRNEEERARHEESRRESERQFHQLVELSPEAIFVVDEDEIVFMNAAGKRLLNLPPNGRAPGASRLFEGIAIRDAGSDWSQAVETTLILPSGGSIDTEILATAITFRGRPCIQLLCQNITARKQRMDSERQAHKMEAIGRLAGGIAHDFNNILTAILGYCELAQLQIPDEYPGREEIEQIRQAADRASGLTRQLLAFSRRQVLQRKLLDPVLIVSEMEKLLRRVIGENIELIINTDPEVSPILADASQMQQVVINLAVNARDAMPEGGTLTIEIRNSSTPKTLSGVELLVSDNGCGMSEDIRRHLFEPFYTTKAPGQGTGLGLSTVYGIITQTGGTISVQSSPGAGTTFRIFFPAADPSLITPQTSPIDTDTHGIHNETVLLIEDDAMVRSLAATFLRRNGYVVLEADSGSTGLAMAQTQQGRLDLLLTDMILPDQSGEKIAKQIQANHPETAVLFISGYGDSRSRTGQEKSQPRLLQKPFTGSELLMTVRQILLHPRG